MRRSLLVILMAGFLGCGFWNSKPGTPAPNGATTAFDPAQIGAAVALTNSNRRATISGTNTTGRAYTLASKNSGKFYIEFTVVSYAAGSNVSPRLGIAPAGASLTSSVGSGANEWAYSKRSDGVGIISNGNATIVTGYSAIVNGSVVGIAVDMTASKIWFALNNVWQGAGADPASGANPTATITAATTYLPCISYLISGTQTGVVDSPSTQTYAPPSGFSAWS